MITPKDERNLIFPVWLSGYFIVFAIMMAIAIGAIFMFNPINKTANQNSLTTPRPTASGPHQPSAPNSNKADTTTGPKETAQPGENQGAPVGSATAPLHPAAEGNEAPSDSGAGLSR